MVAGFIAVQQTFGHRSFSRTLPALIPIAVISAMIIMGGLNGFLGIEDTGSLGITPEPMPVVSEEIPYQQPTTTNKDYTNQTNINFSLSLEQTLSTEDLLGGI